LKKIFTFGHRGAAGYEPENTLRSFHRALELGADGIELDVRKSKDGVVVVIHDDMVNRTSNGRGKVSELSFSRLRDLDFGKGERIPTLENVFEVFQKKCLINVELKESGLVDDLLKLIERFDLWGYVFVSAFDTHESKENNNPSSWNELLSMKEKDSRVQISLLAKSLDAVDLALDLAKTKNIFSINLQLALFMRTPNQTTHKLSLIHKYTKTFVFVYTVNFKMACNILKSVGVDGIFSDYPDIITSL